MTLARLTAIVPAVTAALVITAGLWLTGTESGTRWLAGKARERVAGLDYAEASGTLFSAVTLTGFSWRSETLETSAVAISADLDLSALLSGTVRLEEISLSGAAVITTPSAQGSDTGFQGIGFPLLIDAARVDSLQLDIAGARQEVTRAAFSASLRGRDLQVAIERLDIRDAALAGHANVDLGFSRPAILRVETLAPINPGSIAFSVDAEATPERIKAQGTTTAPVPLSLVAEYVAGSRAVELEVDHRDATLMLKGELLDDGARGTFDFGILGVPGNGRFEVRRPGGGNTEGTLNLRQGKNRLEATLSEQRATLTAELADLASLAGSRLTGSRLTGSRLTGSRLTGPLSLNAGFNLQSRAVSASVTGELMANTSIDGNYDGTLSRGQIHLDVESDAYRGTAGATMNVRDATLFIEPQQLKLAAGPESWSLADAGNQDVTVSTAGVSIAGLCLTDGSATACLEEARLDGSADISTRVRITDLERGSLRVPTAQARATLRGGELDLAARADAITVGNLSITDTRLEALGAPSSPGVSLSGSVRLPGPDGLLNLYARGEIDASSLNVNAMQINGASTEIDGDARFEFADRLLSFSAAGTAYARPVEARGQMTLTDALPVGEIEARSGEDLALTINASGDGAQVVVDIPRPGAFAPSLAGRMRLEGNISSSMDWRLALTSSDVSIGNTAIERLQANLSGQQSQRLDGNIEVSSKVLGEASARLSGSLAEPGLLLRARNRLVSVDAEARANLTGDRQRIAVNDATVTIAGQPWQADGPVNLTRDRASVSLSAHCWRYRQASLCIDETGAAAEGLNVRATLRELALDQFRLPGDAADVSLDGAINGELAVSAPLPLSLTTLQGSFELDSERIDLRDDEEAAQSWDLALTGNIDGDKMNASLLLTSNGSHRAFAAAAIPSLQKPDRFRVESSIDVGSIAIIGAFVPQIANASGSMTAEMTLSTLNGRPDIEISARLDDNASVLVPAAGIELYDIQAELGGDERRVDMQLSAMSGEGRITADGFIKELLSGERTVEASVQGDRVTAINLPDIRVIASPDVTVVYQGERSISVRGGVVVNDGAFTLSQLRASRRSPSTDVRVVSRDPSTSVRMPLDLQLETTVEKFDIDLYGLKGNVQGDLNLVQRAGTPRRANGNLRLVDGTFSRFGQSFDVERGRLVFAGPLTNPTVDVVSTRTIDETDRTVKVTLTLFGPANDIRSTVSATPAMTEAAALSYLVLGRPIARTSDADEQRMATAALVLGLNRATGLTDKFRKVLGLESLAITSGDTTSVIAGKQLSRDLFVEYSYDVTGEASGFLFDYRLSDRLSLQTRTGDEQSMQLIYSF